MRQHVVYWMILSTLQISLAIQNHFFDAPYCHLFTNGRKWWVWRAVKGRCGNGGCGEQLGVYLESLGILMCKNYS